MSGSSIGFVGLGNMGGPMANNLVAAGYDTVVCDVSADAVERLVAEGAHAAATPAEVASRAEVVLLSLPTPDVVHRVATGDDGITSGSHARIVVDLSTTGPGGATELAAALGEHDITAIDAPVSGGVAGATKGSLTIMVSGRADAFAEVEPVLGVLGTPYVVGDEPGMAQVMKILNNLVSVTALAVSSEAMTLGTKSGLDPLAMLDVLNAGSGRNGATMDKIPKHVLSGRFDFGFSVALSRKDTGLCLDYGESQGVPMIVGSAVRQLLAITQAQYGAEADMTMIARTIEEWADTEVRPRD